MDPYIELVAARERSVAEFAYRQHVRRICRELGVTPPPPPWKQRLDTALASVREVVEHLNSPARRRRWKRMESVLTDAANAVARGSAR